MYTPVWRPSGVPWAARLLRGRRATFCSHHAPCRAESRAPATQKALSPRDAGVARGVMYAVPWAARLFRGRRATFCSARGVMYACVPWAERLLRGRRATFCSARGVMYASGVSLASLWRPVGCRDVRLWRPSGVLGLRAFFRGVMYASGVPLASFWQPLGCAPFTWQARDFLLCKGRDVRLWRPSGVPLASLGLRAFCVAGARLSALQGA